MRENRTRSDWNLWKNVYRVSGHHAGSRLDRPSPGISAKSEHSAGQVKSLARRKTLLVLTHLINSVTARIFLEFQPESKSIVD